MGIHVRLDEDEAVSVGEGVLGARGGNGPLGTTIWGSVVMNGLLRVYPSLRRCSRGCAPGPLPLSPGSVYLDDRARHALLYFLAVLSVPPQDQTDARFALSQREPPKEKRTDLEQQGANRESNFHENLQRQTG